MSTEKNPISADGVELAVGMEVYPMTDLRFGPRTVHEIGGRRIYLDDSFIDDMRGHELYFDKAAFIRFELTQCREYIARLESELAGLAAAKEQS